MKLHLPKGLLVAVLAAALCVTKTHANTGFQTDTQTIYVGGPPTGGFSHSEFTEVSYTSPNTTIGTIDVSSCSGTIKVVADAETENKASNVEVGEIKVADRVHLDFRTNEYDWSGNKLKYFDILAIEKLTVGGGSGTVDLSVSRADHIVSIEQVSGTVGAINNTGTLSIGETGGTTTIGGKIYNTGTLTLTGTIIASGDFVSNAATQNGYTVSKSIIVGMTGSGTYNLSEASFVSQDGTTAYTLQDGVYAAAITEMTDTQYHVVSSTVKASEVTQAGGHTGYTVYNGATLDVNGKQLNSQRVVLRAGATLANYGNDVANGTGYNKEQLKTLELEGNATVDTTGNMGVVASNWTQAAVNLNNSTLTKKGGDMLCIANAAISAGKIDIQEGTVKLVDKVLDGHTTGTLSMNEGLIINVEEGASLDWWSDKTAKEYGGVGDTSYTSFLRNITGGGSINIDLAAGSAVVIHGTETNAYKVDFSGTLNMSNDTKLVLGSYHDADDESYNVKSWGLDMSDATISLNGGGMRFCGSNTTIGTLDINANESLFIQDTPSEDTVGLTVNKLNLDADLSITNRWKGAIDIDVLQGSGNLSITKGQNVVKVNIKEAVEGYSGSISVTNAELTLGTADSVVYLSKAITNNGSLTLTNVSFALDNMSYALDGDTSQTGVIEAGHKYTLISGDGSVSANTLACTLNDAAVTDGIWADDKKSFTVAVPIYNIAAGGSTSATDALQATASNGTGVGYVNVLGTMTGLSDAAWGSSSTPIQGSGKVEVTGLLEDGVSHMAAFTGTVLVDGTGENKGRIHLGNSSTKFSNVTAIELVGAPGLTVSGDTNKGYITGWGANFSQQIVLKGGAINADKDSKWQNITVENAGDSDDTTDTISYYAILNSGTGITEGTLKLNGGTLKILNSSNHTMQLGGVVRFDGGVLDLNGTTVDSGTRISNLQVVRGSTGHIKNGTVYISTFDMRGGGNNLYGGTLDLTNAHLHIRDANWMHADNTKILLNEDSSVTYANPYAEGTEVISHKGSANIGSIVALETGDGIDNKMYTRQSDVAITNADVSVTAASAMNVEAQLSNSSLTNNGTGTLTATNSSNNLSGIHAAAGKINLQNVNLDVQQELLSLSIAEGMGVAAHVGTQEFDSADGKAKLTVASTGTATFADNSTLNADLEIKGGAKVTANGALNLNGSTLTLGAGITLDGTLAKQLIALPADDKLALFSGITELNFIQADGVTRSTSATVAYTEPVDITRVFSVEDVQAGMYELTFSDGILWASHMVVPEPATATLSLLALAGLMARRRRAR